MVVLLPKLASFPAVMELLRYLNKNSRQTRKLLRAACHPLGKAGLAMRDYVALRLQRFMWLMKRNILVRKSRGKMACLCFADTGTREIRHDMQQPFRLRPAP
jgi:hypothetical protein